MNKHIPCHNCDYKLWKPNYICTCVCHKKKESDVAFQASYNSMSCRKLFMELYEYYRIHDPKVLDELINPNFGDDFVVLSWHGVLEEVDPKITKKGETYLGWMWAGFFRSQAFRLGWGFGFDKNLNKKFVKNKRTGGSRVVPV